VWCLHLNSPTKQISSHRLARQLQIPTPIELTATIETQLSNQKSCACSGAGALNVRMNYKGTATTASSRHPGGVNLALVDGSVRFVSESVSRETWWALGSRADGDVVAAY